MTTTTPRSAGGVWRALVTGCLLAAVAAPAAQAAVPGLSGTLSGTVAAAGPAYLNPALAALAEQDPARALDVIVQFDASATDGHIDAALGAVGAEIKRPLPLVTAAEVSLEAADLLKLVALPGVRAITPDAETKPTGITVDYAKLAPKFPLTTKSDNAWKDFTGKGIGVAIVDTGVQGTHRDFSKDGTTASRVIANVVVNPGATSPRDTVGHGTHIAGLIAGDSTKRDKASAMHSKYVGVAPEANLVSIKVDDDSGVATVADVIAGIQFAVDHRATYNIRVLNLSVNSSVAQSYTVDPLSAAAEAAWFKGITVVVAAGNKGTDGDAVHYAPANDPYVITVGAVDESGTADTNDDVITAFSSRGVTQDGFAKPDVNAPGAKLVGTLSPNSAFAAQCPGCVVDGEYLRIGGTSMATGVVSGAVANLLQQRPGLTPNEVKGALISTLAGRVKEINQARAAGAAGSALISNQGLTPNSSVNASTGEIDESASWRASWRAAPSTLTASWSAASFSCAECTGDGSTATMEASWRASWRASWNASWRAYFER